MKRRGSCAFLIFVTVSSCAVPEPPSGGPEDRVSPYILSTIPSPDSVGVDASSKITVTFSEKMIRARIERQFIFYPHVSIGAVEWRKNSIVLSPEGLLHPDTTYLVVIKPGFRDIHNVRNDEGYRFAFSTSAHLDSGVISGKVFFRRKPSDRALARCFLLAGDSAFSPEAARPNREVVTDGSGAFSFSHLPTRGSRFVVWAFQDENGNFRFDRGNEFGAVFPETLALTGEEPKQHDADIYIVDPNEPGTVTGSIVNNTGIDTIPVSVAMYGRVDTAVPAYLTFCGAKGVYRFKSVRSGAYVLKAFLDLQADSICGTYECGEDTCMEPCASFPDTVRVSPGEKLLLDALPLSIAEEERDRE